jgi:lipopolysaccharide export system permease protein
VDLELTAIRAAGASPLRIARVPILVGAVVSLLALPLAYFGEPYGLNLLYDRLVDVGLRNLSEAIQPGVFNETFEGIALFSKGRRANGALDDVLLFDARDRTKPTLVLARKGDLRVVGGRELALDLDDGEMYLAGGEQKEARYDRVRFLRSHLGIDVGEELRGRTHVVSDIGRMYADEMWAAIRALGPEDRRARAIERTYWRRFALPLMAFVFAVVGTGLVLSGRGGARARTVLLALLAFVGYYVLLRIADIFALSLRGAALPMAWAPNLIALAAGALLLVRAGRPR